MPTIKLIELQCILNDEIDKDEIYIKHNGKKIWPSGIYNQVDSGETKEIGMDLKVDEGWLELELWDFDYMSRNDHLGTFKMMIDQEKGKFSTSLQKKDLKSTASYILNWELH